MKILIIGGGLIGVTSAYFLQRQGHEVTVVDQAPGVGLGTSFANGGLLTASMSDPWNAPGIGRVLWASLFRADSAVQVRWRSVPSLLPWGVRFLRNATVKAFERNSRSNLRLSLLSLDAMQALREETDIQYGRATVGTLRIFRDGAALRRATLASHRLSAAGMRSRVLSSAEVLHLEPALNGIAAQLKGAIHYEADESGDAYLFCMNLAKHAQRLGVHFQFDTTVQTLDRQGERVTAAMIEQGRLTADRFVVAAGNSSATLLRDLGIRLPVQPVKGYSVTFDRTAHSSSLRIPIIDDDLHAAVVPLAGTLRVAGTAEFCGYDLKLNPRRISKLLALLPQVLPQAQVNPTSGKLWCGHRPMSADGVPVIGPTAIENVWVNTGHGHLGWTMAAGSAQLLADRLSGRRAAIDATPYDIDRF